jgi:hypothetical protein
MIKSPPCDFWMFEELPNGRVVEIERDSESLYQADLRNERYDLDVERWSREWYWDARQAAIISFLRDPAKIDEADDDLFGIPETDDEYKKHLALEDAIDGLRKRIIDAQRQGLLPSDFFCPSNYLAWASRTEVDFPGAILQEVQRFQSEMSHKANEQKPSLEGQSPDPDHADNPKAHGAEAKLSGTLLKIILALLIRFVGGYDRSIGVEAAKSKVKKADANALAKHLEDILKELETFSILKGDKFSVTKRTINDHLSSAGKLVE